MIVHWSRIDHAKDTRPVRESSTWPELCDTLAAHGRTCDGKDGPSIIPCTYNGTRHKRNIEAMHLLVLDIDHGVQSPRQWVADNIKWQHFAWSSWNDGVDNEVYSVADGARFRVMVPLSEPIGPDLLDAFAEHVREQFPDADRQVAANSNALYFTPRRRNPASTRDPWCVRGDGEPYPVNAGLLAKRALALVRERREATERQKRAAVESLGRVTDTRLQGVLNKIMHGMAAASEGERTMRVLTSAKQIVRMDMAYRFGAEGALDALQGIAAASMGPGRLRDIERAIEQGRQYALDDGPEYLEERSSPKSDSAYLASLVKQAPQPGDFGNMDETEPMPEVSTETIRSRLANAPIHAAHTMPSSYILTEAGAILKQAVKNAGTENEEIKLIDVARRPIFISTYLLTDDGDVNVVLTWRKLNTWHQDAISREDIASARRLPKLASKGAPVTSTRARALVDFLEAYEEENAAHISTSRLVTRMGWHPEGFVVGRHIVTEDGYREQDLSTVLLETEGIDTAVIDAYHTRGTFAGWCRAVAPMVRYDYVMTMLCASLGSVLLEHTSTPGFAVDLSWHTSTGKSTAIDVCASAFGRPGNQGLRMDWQATASYMERMAAIMCDLPYFADDTKTARDTGQISQVLYSFVSRGKGRATVTGLQKTVQKQSVLVSTGEMPAVKFSKDDGAAARTVTLQGLTFGAESRETARTVDEVAHGIQHHYGHAVIKLVQWIMRMPTHKLAELSLDYRQTFGDLAATGKGRRKAHSFAVMAIVREWLETEGIVWPIERLVGVFQDCHREDLPKSTEAYNMLHRWCFANLHKFQPHGSAGRNVDAPHSGWAGVVKAAADQRVQAVYVRAETAEEVLSRHGLWESNLPQIWIDQGHVTSARVRLSGERMRLLSLDLSDKED